MGFRHFTSIFNEISEIRQSNLLVNTKLVFSDGSLLVHLHMLEAGGLWWTKCRDLEIPPDEIVYLFPDDSINFGLEMMHELYRDYDSECGIDNNNMNLHEKYDIPELPVRPPVIMSSFHLTPSQPPAVSSYQPMQLQPPISAASVPTFSFPTRKSFSIT